MSRMNWNWIVWVTLAEEFFVLQYFHDTCVMEITYHIMYYHGIHIKGLYWEGIWCDLITQLLKCLIFIPYPSHAHWVKFSKSNRRPGAWIMKAVLCYDQIFSQNSDQQNHVVWNFTDTISSTETCNAGGFDSHPCIFSCDRDEKMTNRLICFHLALLDCSRDGDIHSLLVHSNSGHCGPSSAHFLTEAWTEPGHVIPSILQTAKSCWHLLIKNTFFFMNRFKSVDLLL